MGKKLTTHEYWDSMYKGRGDLEPVDITGYRNWCDRTIFEKKLTSIEKARAVLEIGGGASPWLAFLSKRYPDKRFVSIDYSDEGSEQLRSFVKRSNICNVDVVVDDFFSGLAVRGAFDFVYSHGVVEHFADLSEVLAAHSRFLAEEGRMLTVIPNMSGIIGILTRILNKDVYNIHVPHDERSLKQGHTAAGLRVVESGYLCSNNFGVLSSCVRDKRGVRWHIYKLLSRVSKLVWLFEDKVVRLPATKLFSPYIYVLSERNSRA